LVKALVRLIRNEEKSKRTENDGSRALQKEWHRKAGFSAVSSDSNHPRNSSVSSWPSRGTDSGGNVGSPRGAKFSWE